MRPKVRELKHVSAIDMPGRNLVGSFKARMLTSAEIDLLRQDLKVAVQLASQLEVDMAERLLVEHGYRPAEFEVRQNAFPVPNVGEIVIKLTVLRRTNAADMVYGSGREWVSAFARDVASGAFGPYG